MSSEENISIAVNEQETSKQFNADSTKVEETTTTETTTPVTVSDRAVGIHLSMVVRCSNLIENLATRGCFRANELSEVGELYNNLKQLLNNALIAIREEQVSTEEQK